MHLTSVLSLLIGASAVIPPRECDPELVQMCVDKLQPKLDACQDEMRCECNIVITEAASCYAPCPQDNITEFIKGYKHGKCAMFDPKMYVREAKADINNDAFLANGIRPPNQRGGVHLNIHDRSPNHEQYVKHQWAEPNANHYVYGPIPGAAKRNTPVMKIHPDVEKMNPVFVFDYEKGEYTVLQQKNAMNSLSLADEPKTMIMEVPTYKPVATADNFVHYSATTIFTTITEPATMHFPHDHDYNYHFKAIAKPDPTSTALSHSHSPSPPSTPVTAKSTSVVSNTATSTSFASSTASTASTASTSTSTITKTTTVKTHKHDTKKTGAKNLLVNVNATATPEYGVRTHFITTITGLNTTSTKPKSTSTKLSPEEISRLAHKSYLREIRRRKSMQAMDNEFMTTPEPTTSTIAAAANRRTTIATLRRLEVVGTQGAAAATIRREQASTATNAQSHVVVSASSKLRPYWLLLLLAFF